MNEPKNIEIVKGASITDKAPGDDQRTIQEKAKLELGKLDELAEIDTKPILVLKGLFPFELFPTTIIIDRKKITISDQWFFFSRFTQSLLIEDLMSVQARTGIFFATLHIIDKHFPGETVTVKYLPVHVAVRARRIIEGLMVTQKENIDLTYIPAEELIPLLEEIGKGK